MNRYAIILAAGKGSRMKSKRDDISKVSFPILGQPLVKYVIEALKPLRLEKLIAVVGFGGKTSEKVVKDDCEVVWQHEQKGAGHAVMMTSPLLEGKEGETIVCCGDTPLLSSQTLEKMFQYHEENHNDLTVMTFVLDNPFGYGRIIKENGRFMRIVEQRDTTPETACVKEVNAGVYIFNNKALFEALKNLKTDNAAGEYYITDAIEIFVKEGLKTDTFRVEDISETLGVNDRAQLAVAAKLLQKRINHQHMINGVTIEDPDNTYIAPNVKIGADSIIKPGSYIMGNSVIGEECVIGPNAVLDSVTVKDNEIVKPNEIRQK